MTSFTNRLGQYDEYDEKALQDVISSARVATRVTGQMPTAVGVSPREYDELRKAETAGVIPMIEFKGKRYRVNYVLANNFARIRTRVKGSDRHSQLVEAAK